MAAREDADLRAAVRGSSLTVPDGQPLVWALRALGHRLPDRVYGPDGLHALLAESDIVVLAAPLTHETDGFIDDAAIAAMRRDTWLINVARGRLIDDTALIRALTDDRIGGVALDTFREEPLPQASPLWDLPNVIVTPHTSWSSARVLDRSIDLFCDNLRRFRAGEPLRNVVDRAAGY